MLDQALRKMIKSRINSISPMRVLVSSRARCPRRGPKSWQCPTHVRWSTKAASPASLHRHHSSNTSPTSACNNAAEPAETFAFGPAFLSSLEESCRHAKVKTISLGDLRLMAEEAKAIEKQLSEPSDPIPRTVNIEFTAHMVAAYRIIKKSGLPALEIGQLLEDAIQRAMSPASEFVRADLDSSPDPFARVVGQSKDKEQHFYIAPDFDIKRVRDEPGSYHVRVDKCWYMTALQKLDAREIGPVFCTFDRAWYACIDPKKHGFTFARPTTIAGGDGSCAFNFDRTATQPGPTDSD